MSLTDERKKIYARAQRHLTRKDPVLKRVIRAIGPCTLYCDSDHFGVLVRSILSQQISTKAANSITAKLYNKVQPHGVRPDTLLSLTDDDFQGAGVSPQKRRYLRDLAARVHSNELVLAELPGLSDEDVIAHLLPVKGVGRWTAEMFLIFSLGRLDVLPLADLGLRAGVKREYELADLPKNQQLLDLTQAWRPYCSIATWFMWRTFGDQVPQS